MELFWRMGKFENIDVVYGKVLSMEDSMLASHHLASAHGYYGRYLLRRNRPADALECLTKAAKGYQVTSIADEHHTACVQSLAIIACTSAISNADELIDGYGIRPDVAAIRRFAVAFLSADVAALEQVLDETLGTFEDREVRRLLRHCESVLKRKLCLRTSPLPNDCWSDVLQCLTHPVWHDLQSLCRKFEPLLAPLLHHLHSDVQKVAFKRDYAVVAGGFLERGQIAFHFKSGRATKEVQCDHTSRGLGHDLLAGVVLQYVPVVEIDDPNSTTDEAVLRFCFEGDGRRLE
ncbi:hypothetical protein AAVH_31989, partial [Aphelenchoides avenae]